VLTKFIKMKLLVIGHSVLDFIKSDKEQKISAGGIFYSISALNHLTTSDDEIFLCSQFDDETYNYFKPEFEKLNSEFLQKVEKIPRVHLNLQKDRERHEAYENITNNLSLSFSDLNNYDGILINMITGFDISIVDFKKRTVTVSIGLIMVIRNEHGKVFLFKSGVCPVF